MDRMSKDRYAIPDEKLGEALLKHAANNDIITAGTYNMPEGDTAKNAIGIYYSHAYTVLDVQDVTETEKAWWIWDSDISTRRILIKIRNPHGTA